jgi:hypothetical protein
MEDWSHTVTEVVPNLMVGGKPATRPVPKTLPDQDVSRVALHLAYHKRAEDEDYDFTFTVLVASKSLKEELFARSQCSWWDGNPAAVETRLSCWIDCDGGGMGVTRVPGSQSVDVMFSYLSMQAGCEGGGAFRVGTGGEADRTSFRIAKAPLEACAPLKAWARDQ